MKLRKLSLLTIVTAVTLTVVGAYPQPPVEKAGDDSVYLELGRPIERELGGKAVDDYFVRLEAGGLLVGNAEQKNVDVVVTVFGPDQQRLGVFDGPNGSAGPEPFRTEPSTTGAYRIAIAAFDTSAVPGKYEISITELLTRSQQAARLAAERASAESVSRWFARKAVRLDAVEAGQGFADMAPLKRMIGDARIVALGEATHGTREFFQLTHRMLEFLVTEMGFTAFGVEAGVPECFDINDYVLTGNGDPVKVLAGTTDWIWDTKEMLATIEWLRRYNADPSHVHKVKFYGLDMQSPTRAARATLDYLRRADPQYADSAASALGLLANPLASDAVHIHCLPEDRRQALIAVIQSARPRFDAHKPDYVERTSLEEWTIARQHAQVLTQFAQMYLVASQDVQARDRAMADNVGWILEQEGPNSKVVVWVHNCHVSADSVPGHAWMGYLLRRRFGSAMYNFGFAFNQGSFQAVEIKDSTLEVKGLRPFTVPPAADGTIENLLARAGLTVAAVDFRALPTTGSVAEWFSRPSSTFWPAVLYAPPAQGGPVDWRRSFDGILFVEKTTAAQPTSGTYLPPPQKLLAPANLDFEDTAVGNLPDRPADLPDLAYPSRAGLPADWTVPYGLDRFDFRVVSSRERPYHAERCLEISRSAGKHYGEHCGSINQCTRAEPYRGKKIRLRAAVRAEVSGTGNQAQLWLRCCRLALGPERIAFFDCMSDRPITDAEWRTYEIVAEVAADVETIDYGCALIGDGEAWVDAMSVETVEK